MTDREKLDAIEKLCRRHCSPAVNLGAHQLASYVLEILDEKSTRLTDLEIVKRSEPDQLP